MEGNVNERKRDTNEGRELRQDTRRKDRKKERNEKRTDRKKKGRK
jgi:hypothetical protein